MFCFTEIVYCRHRQREYTSGWCSLFSALCCLLLRLPAVLVLRSSRRSVHLVSAFTRSLVQSSRGEHSLGARCTCSQCSLVHSSSRREDSTHSALGAPVLSVHSSTRPVVERRALCSHTAPFMSSAAARYVCTTDSRVTRAFSSLWSATSRLVVGEPEANTTRT